MGLSRNEMRYMAITRKLRQKVCDGSLREMRQEAKWIFAYIRRYRAAVGIHILLGILGTALSLLSSVAMKTLIDVVTGFAAVLLDLFDNFVISGFNVDDFFGSLQDVFIL